MAWKWIPRAFRRCSSASISFSGSRSSGARGAALSESRASLVEALQPVVGDRLPVRRIGDVGSEARAHSRVAVEGAQPDAHPRRIVGVAGEDVPAAGAAEA